MSCYNCLTKFSIFTKEHSCPGCNFSFCSKCLKQKITLDGEEKNVCQNCFKKFNSESSVQSSSDFETPDLLVKRLETLENPARPPITIFRHSARLANLKYGLSSEDKKIVERLEKLKADQTVSILPDEDEIKRRLALLQDRSVESISRPQKLGSTLKSQQEEVDELLKQYTEETEIQENSEISGSTKTSDIENRLKKLQMSETTMLNPDSGLHLGDEDLENEDSEAVRIIKKAIAEGQLERRLKESMGGNENSDISDMDDEDEPESELPWCIICNENAAVKCFGCDGSLYCNACFKQGHEFFDMADHKFIPYVKKDSLSEG